jgi:hypothetical protein
MLTTGGLVPPALQAPVLGSTATWRVPRTVLVLLVLAVVGLGLAAIERVAPSPVPVPPAPLESIASDPPVGDIPIIGDPVRDLTVWYSDRVRDANRAALDNLRGQLLTPIDPLTANERGR